jgi:tetratricopeptide (TPR) repeat protein
MSWRLVRIACIALALSALARPAGAACVLEKIVEIPVVMDDLSPIMAARINGQDARLLVDFGAFFSSISRSRLDKFHLKAGSLPPGLEIRGVNGVADVGMTTSQDFDILGAHFKHTQFLAGGSEFGPRADGILGRNFLMLADAELDLGDGAVRLFNAKGCSGTSLAYWANTTPYSVVTLDQPRRPNDRIVGTAKVNGQTIRVLFDTGASTSVLTLKAAARSGVHREDPGVVPAGLTHGFGQRSIETWIAPVESFKIGDEEIKHTRLRIGALELEDVDMLIGADFMLSHRIYVARSQNKLYFTYSGGPVFRLEDAQPAPRPSDVPKAPPPPAAEAPAGDEPKDAAGYARRGAAFAARRELDRAVADFTKAMELDPKEARYAYDRAGARIASREPLLALADLDLALKLMPDFPMALLERGRLKLGARDEPSATADLEAALKLDPSLRLQVAQTYQSTDFPAQAIPQYDQWIAANPKDERLAFALTDRCRARALLNREIDQALADCERALKLRPSTAEIIESRGMVRYRMGQYDQAIADFGAALKLQPQLAWALYGRGLAELKTGKTAEGQADLKAANELARPLIVRLRNRYGLAPDAPGKP